MYDANMRERGRESSSRMQLFEMAYPAIQISPNMIGFEIVDMCMYI